MKSRDRDSFAIDTGGILTFTLDQHVFSIIKRYDGVMMPDRLVLYLNDIWVLSTDGRFSQPNGDGFREGFGGIGDKIRFRIRKIERCHGDVHSLKALIEVNGYKAKTGFNDHRIRRGVFLVLSEDIENLVENIE